MLISYLLSFVDKGILSTAAVYGLRTDLVRAYPFKGFMVVLKLTVPAP